MAPPSEESPPFQVGDRVVQRAQPSIVGEVLEPPERDGPDWWIKVRFGAKVVQQVSTRLDLYDEGATVESLARSGSWGTFEAIRLAVALERILKSTTSTVKAFNSQRIQLYPHQYKPLLKVLESDDRRLLVADEVGLGKTIEAGLVLAELEARGALSRVLIICPSRLREKWRDEMERKFGQSFDIWGAAEIRDYIGRAMRSPERSSFRAVTSLQGFRRQPLLEQFLSVAPSLDFVIFDEAHHARNRSTATFRMARDVSSKADGMLLLTATPLHLGQGDLYSMVHLLRESEFSDEQAFIRSVRRNEGVVRAQSAARRRSPDELAAAAAIIRAGHGIGPTGVSEDPLLRQVLASLEGRAPSTQEAWLDLERLLERAHVLSHVFTRTKKRDAYENIPERRPAWVHVNWTTEEHLAYCQLAGLDPDRPDDQQFFNLGSIQRARQAASSIHGTLLYGRDKAGSEFEGCDLDDLDEAGHSEAAGIVVPPVDSKLEELRRSLSELLEEDPARKVIVFTYFVGTSKYLERELCSNGIPAVRIAGDVVSNPRQPELDERAQVIARFREDPAVRVLVSTEVGSEGLDFQFCSCLINYDLPWNPMVVEQRIGRIDRLGQEADVLHIVSLVVMNTVEDRVLEKLYSRLGICERSIGDLEGILGEELGEIHRGFYSGKLTTAQLKRRVEDTAAVLEKRVQGLKALEARSPDLLGHEDFIRDEINRVRQLGRYLTDSQIRSVVEGYLQEKHPDVRMVDEGGGVLRIPWSSGLRDAVERLAGEEEERLLQLRGRVTRGYLRATTDGEVAYGDSKLDLLNSSHPLVKAAALSMKGLLDKPQGRVGSARLRLSRLDEEDDFRAGNYFLAMFSIDLANPSSGRGTRRLLEVIGIHGDTLEPLGSQAAERLLHLCMERGEQPPRTGVLEGMPEEAWREMVSDARSRKKALESRESETNASMYTRRKQRLIDERDRKRRGAVQRLETLRENDRREQMINLAKAQLDMIDVRYAQMLEKLEGREPCEAELSSDPLMCCCIIIE